MSLTLGLAACGGGGGGGDAGALASNNTASQYSLGGTVTGLSGTVVLKNNDSETVSIGANNTYQFATKLSSGELYNVVVATQPVNQICSVASYSGVVDGADITNANVYCSPANSTISLAGSFSAVPMTQIDSDINDPNAAANVSNNDFASAQVIPNFAQVQGFVSKAATLRTQEGDRFASLADSSDVYRVVLQKDQLVQLQVADFAGIDVFEGDVDLTLYDTSLAIKAFSNQVDEFESMRVPADGEYYIVVSAYSGKSKYSLSLTSVQKQSVLSLSSLDFIAGEAVVQFKPTALKLGAKSANLAARLNHSDTSRATLARFDTVAAKGSGGQQEDALLQQLATLNPESYQKLKTLLEIKRLNQRDDVEFAEPNYLYQAYQTPNDQYYASMWHYPAINLPQAWDITTGSRAGSDVIVAVVDTGVYLAHPDFAGQLVTGYDFISRTDISRDGNGIDPNPDDPGDSPWPGRSSWHGTHVAGTVAAASNNTTGIAGVAWHAKVMPVRALGAGGGTGYDIIQAVRYAAGLSNDSGTLPVQKADIINLSLGGTGYSQASQNVYTEIRNAGVIVVAAAGNAGNSQLHYPASYNDVISVSATDFANQRAPYSSYGSRVDVAAPGGHTGADHNGDGQPDGVLSALVNDSTGTRSPTYKFYQGTSMATPHMAGVLALMRAVHPTLSPDDVDQLLASGTITTDLGPAGRDDQFGHGLIDALKAVEAAQSLANSGNPPLQPAIIVAEPHQITFGLLSSATLNLSNAGDTVASVSTQSTDVSWLTVTAGNVDANGMGDYSVAVDRTGLANSIYQGSITFSLDNGDSVSVQVTMMVSQVDTSGKIGTLYMLLMDDTNTVIYQTNPVEQGNGTFSYQFENVPPGQYRVLGGSDIDNDGYICQTAEMCGGYPQTYGMSLIDVSNVDISGIDFVVYIRSSYDSGTLSVSDDTPTQSTGIRRMPR